ncbi:unnamed protein product [Tenebrio molitor]|nr:unnamed protein product [Tenebrio molitor]
MSQEDRFLYFLKEANVDTGNVTPGQIKAWFDTDCADLLNWISSSFNQDNMISSQEQSEFAQQDNVLTGEKLEEKVEILETEYPDLMSKESNLLRLEIANDTLNVLEEQLADLDSEAATNKLLYQSLIEEFSTVSSEKILSEQELESGLEECTTSSRRLDSTSKEASDAILKYSLYLNEIRITGNEQYLMNGIVELEERLTSLLRRVGIYTRLCTELLEEATRCEPFREIENRILQSKASFLALQVDVEGLQFVLDLLENYDSSTSSPDLESLESCIRFAEDEQLELISGIEKNVQKDAARCVDPAKITFSRDVLDSWISTFNDLHLYKEPLEKVVTELSVMYALCCRQKPDMFRLVQLVKDKCKDLHNCRPRMEAMVREIDDFELFKSKSVEDKFKLISSVGVVAFKKNMSLAEMVNKRATTTARTHQLRSDCLVLDIDVLKTIHSDIKILTNFLVAGSTCKIQVLPSSLEELFFKVAKHFQDLRYSVGWTLTLSRESKKELDRDKWLRFRDQLWRLYLLDPSRMLSWIDKLPVN